jgi:hypothetical protein
MTLFSENNVHVYVVYCKTNDIRSLGFKFVTCLHELHNMSTLTKETTIYVVQNPSLDTKCIEVFRDYRPTVLYSEFKLR